MIRLAAILLTILMGFTPAGHAGNVTVSLGDTHANLAPSGNWWQKEYPHDLPTDVPSLTVRYDWDMGLGSGLKVGVGYTYIGHFKSSAVAVGSDNAYTLGVPYPTSHWYGDETMQGLFVVARKDFGDWYIEAGPMLTHAKWIMHVPDWVDCIDSPVYGGPCLQPRATTYDLTVGEPSQWRIGVRLGAGYRISGKWSLDWAYVPTHIFSKYPGITAGMSSIFSVGYTFD